MPSEKTSTEVEVRIGRSSFHNVGDAETNRREYYIQITDRPSGVRIMEIRLDATGFAEMLNNAGAIGTAEVLNARNYAQAVGRHGFGASLLLNRDFDGDGYSHSDVRMNNLIENAALADELRCAYGSAHPERDGLRVTFRGHADTHDEAVDEGRRLALDLELMATNGGWATKGAAHSFPSADR